MSSYQKFTLGTFKKKLENGDYENATGANRAIGKTQELSEKEKAKAKAMVVSHFGTEPVKSAKKSKKASKKAGKKSGKAKVAKAVTKKAATKRAKKTATKPAPKSAKKASKRAKKTSKRRAAVTTTTAAEPDPAIAPAAIQRTLRPLRKAVTKVAPTDASTRVGKIQLMGQVINHVDIILRSMELSKRLFPKGDIERGVKSAQSIMNRAVRELEEAVVPPESGSTEAQTTPAAAAKPPSRKGKRVTKPTTATASAPVPTGDGEGAVDLNDPSLTEADRAEIREARKVKPAVEKRFGGTPASA